MGPEYYVNVMSFVDKTQLEPGCTVLLHNKVSTAAAVCSSQGLQPSCLRSETAVMESCEMHCAELPELCPFTRSFWSTHLRLHHLPPDPLASIILLVADCMTAAGTVGRAA